jgi:hypothetical protein
MMSEKRSIYVIVCDGSDATGDHYTYIHSVYSSSKRADDKWAELHESGKSVGERYSIEEHTLED